MIWPKDREVLLGRELLVIKMSGERKEVRDLFIRLQAGTPLAAQEKREAWPGNFTRFVIRPAGKLGHPNSNPKPFFNLVPRNQRLTVDDGNHYVDRPALTRKFLAGLAMTIMVRERSGEDFVDLKGKSMKQQFTELQVIRYPLSRNPATDLVNTATGRPFSSTPVPGIDLHFCPQSGTSEQVTPLGKLCSRLALPDGRDFPEGSVEFSVEADPRCG